MVITRTHSIWLSQVASIPTVHVRFLLVLGGATGSLGPGKVIPDIKARKTVLPLGTRAVTPQWLPGDSVHQSNALWDFNVPPKCCFPLSLQVYDKLTAEHFPVFQVAETIHQ